MIIGFDGKRAVQNNTGLGNYSRLLVEKMATIFPDNRYRVYAPRAVRIRAWHPSKSSTT